MLRHTKDALAVLVLHYMPLAVTILLNHNKLAIVGC
jgi:hypothetical protein